MKRIPLITFFCIAMLIMQVGCSKKDSPTSPGGGNPTAATDTPQATATVTPQIGTATDTPVIDSPTETDTISATPTITPSEDVSPTFTGTSTVTLPVALDNPPAVITTSGDADWYAWDGWTFSGTHAARAGVIGNNQSSSMFLNVDGPVDVSFYWYASCEDNQDYIYLYIDSVQTGSLTGLNGWEPKGPYTLGPGAHTIEWRFVKDASGSAYGDTAYVDMLVVAPIATETVTPTVTETSTEPATFTPTENDTLTSTDTVTATVTETSTDLPTFTATGTDTNTPTATETSTDLPTLTQTPSWTVSDTATTTATFTDSPTMTITRTATGTGTDTVTATPTTTVTPTNTPLSWTGPSTVYGSAGNWPCIVGGAYGFTDASYYPHAGGNYSSQYVAGELGKKWFTGNYAAIANYTPASATYGEALLLFWNGTNWDNIASVSGSGVYGGQCSIFQDPYNGDIYYAYTADTGDQKVHVKKYSGGSWTDLNHHGSGTGKAYKSSVPGYLVITGYNNGTGAMIYVAYADWNSNSKVAVSNYDGFGWNTLWGGGYASTAAGSGIDMVADGASYNVYLTYTDTNRTYVKRSSGGAWASMGALNPVSDANGFYNSIYAASSSEVYVAYSDSGQASKATVKKFNGTSWSIVGTAGFTPAAISYSGLYKGAGVLRLLYKNATGSTINEMTY